MVGIGDKWFADTGEGAPEGYPWVPCVRVTGAVHQLDGIWFSSEEDCERFIEEEILK
jgi:hypothetical protein